jgi:hypothetical protein
LDYGEVEPAAIAFGLRSHAENQKDDDLPFTHRNSTVAFGLST